MHCIPLINPLTASLTMCLHALRWPGALLVRLALHSVTSTGLARAMTSLAFLPQVRPSVHLDVREAALHQCIMHNDHVRECDCDDVSFPKYIHVGLPRPSGH